MASALFHIANTRLKPWQVQMMQLFDDDDLFEVWSKEIRPVVGRHYNTSSSFDTSCAMLHCAEPFKTFAMSLSLPTFVLRYRRSNSPKPIRGKFCVTNYEKCEVDFAVFVCECTPGKVFTPFSCSYFDPYSCQRASKLPFLPNHGFPRSSGVG